MMMTCYCTISEMIFEKEKVYDIISVHRSNDVRYAMSEQMEISGDTRTVTLLALGVDVFCTIDFIYNTCSK